MRCTLRGAGLPAGRAVFLGTALPFLNFFGTIQTERHKKGGGTVPDLDSSIRLLGAYWYYAAAAAGIAVLLALYGAAYFRALKPRAGTLEWIALYDRPPLAMAGRWYRLERADAVPLPVCCLLAAAAWGYAAWSSYQAVYPDVLDVPEALLQLGIYYGLLPALTAAGAYCLLKGLFGSTSVTMLGVLILSADLTAEPVSMLAATLLLLGLLRFLTAGEQQTFGESCLPLLLTSVLIPIGCYFQPALLIPSAAVLLLLLAGCTIRFVRLGEGWFLKSLLTAVLPAAVTTLLLHIPAAVAAGLPFPQMLGSGAFYRSLAQRAAAAVSGLFHAGLWNVLPAAAYDWPLLICGLCAAAAAAAGLLRRRDYRGLMLPVWFLALAAMWVLSGLYAMPLACVLCLCYVWADLYRREKYILAGLGAGCLLVLLLAFYILSWIFN